VTADVPFRPAACLLRAGVLALVLAVAVLGMAHAQSAQTAGSAQVPPDASAAELERLIATLEDEGERKAFVENLKTMLAAKRAAATPTAAEAQPASLMGQITAALAARMDAVTQQLQQAGNAAMAVPALLLEAGKTLADPAERMRWLTIVGEVLAVLAGAVVAERLFTRLVARPRARLAPRDHASLPTRVLLILGRLVIDAVPIAAFAAAGWLLIAVLGIAQTPAAVAVTLINAVLVSRAVAMAARALLAPQTPALRLITMSDAGAGYLYRWIRRIGVPGIYGVFGLRAARIAGLNPGAYAIVLKLLGLVLAALVIAFILQNRRRVAAWLSGEARAEGQVATLRRRLADLWHLLAIVYVLAAYGVWALGIRGGFPFLAEATALTLLVGVVARGVHHGLSRLYDKGVDLAPGFDATYPGLEQRLNRYIPTARRVTDIAILVVAAVLILQAWGLDTMAMLATPLGQRLISVVISVGVVVLLAMGAWEVVNALLERLNKRANRESVAAKRSARVQTLLPMLRNAVRIVIVTIATLIALSEIGVDIGPLLAGAGVIGLAIGFGSQTLVKDVITGVFILAEDSLAIGDWVEAGGHMGEVEHLTIRAITLRDLQGQVHVVPFSEVTSILNMSRDYGHSLIDVGVSYREDTDAVIALLQEVAADMRADPHWGKIIVGDLEVFGVNDLGESGVTVRVRIKTQPVMQWGVRREFLRRTKKLFDEKGVEIPYPHRTLYFGQDRDGSAPPARVAMQQPPRAAQTDMAEPAPEPAPAATVPDPK
jgi:small conductance mechanosensitive channel